MRPKSIAIFLLLAGGGPALFAASGFLPERQDRQHAIGELAYHDHPPLEPLPSTLDAAQFVDNHAAFLTYKLAAKPRTRFTKFRATARAAGAWDTRAYSIATPPNTVCAAPCAKRKSSFAISRTRKEKHLPRSGKIWPKARLRNSI